MKATWLLLCLAAGTLLPKFSEASPQRSTSRTATIEVVERDAARLETYNLKIRILDNGDPAEVVTHSGEGLLRLKLRARSTDAGIESSLGVHHQRNGESTELETHSQIALGQRVALVDLSEKGGRQLKVWLTMR